MPSVLPLNRGSIPAWAGETSPPCSAKCSWTVYPRVGGGNREQGEPELVQWGLSPHGRGNYVLQSQATAQHGLSPRGRGKRGCHCPAPWLGRSIPAWAGETRTASRVSACGKVYPRVGGGNRWGLVRRGKARGLSPRGRGKPEVYGFHAARGGSIPAWAGETNTEGIGPGPDGVYPRVGGGNLRQHPLIPHPRGLSPRGRGKRNDWPDRAVHRRSIPAWAGETVAVRASAGHI